MDLNEIASQLKNNIAEFRWIYRFFNEVKDLRRIEQVCSQTTRDYRNFYVVDTEPFIIVTSEATSDLSLFSEHLGQKRAYFIKLFWWSKETFSRMYQESIYYRKHQERFPHHEIYFLCNTPGEKNLADWFGLPAIYCNQNALLDERIYTVQRKIQKQYLAIYNARLDPVKRHLLLAHVKSLALIIGPNLKESLEKRTYRQEIQNILSYATVLNDSDERSLGRIGVQGLQLSPLGDDEVATQLNRAKTGVILSREEGACYASAEYLLCGLPVVTTRSMGGREIFLQGDHVRYVSASPAAVMQAIKEVAMASFNPETITLEKMIPHRQRFKDLLKKIYHQERPNYCVDDNWEKQFVNKMIIYAQPWPEALLEKLY